MISFSFENTLFLWYLASIPLIIISHFFLLRHTRKKAMKFANFEALKRVTGNYLVTKNWIVLILRVLIVALLIFAAAGTKFWYDGQKNDNDFVIAIDVSASMSAEDIPPSRVEAAKHEAINFVDSLQSEGMIGLVSFGGVAIIENVLVNDKRKIQTRISELEIQEAGGTDLSGAIVTATNVLQQNDERGRVLVLLSDGSNTAGPFIDNSMDNAIEYAKEKRVKIHSIGFGTNTGPLGYLKELTGLNATVDEESLMKVSNSTGGIYYRAPDQQALRTAYENISSQSSEAILSLDLSYGMLLAALLLLFVEWGLINTRFRRVP